MAARSTNWRADSSAAEDRLLALLAGGAILFGATAAIALSYVNAIAPPNHADLWRISLGIPALLTGVACLAAPTWVARNRFAVYGFVAVVMLIFTICLHVTAATWPALLMAMGLVTWVAFFLDRVELVVTLTGVTMIALSALTWPPPGIGHDLDAARMLVFIPVMWLLGIDLSRQCDDLREARKMIKYRALSDPLTHLGNLRMLRQSVGEEIAAGHEFGIVTLDLDNFKAANELRGQAGGDAALRLVAERLQATIGRRALVCRPTGDDFAVVVPGSTPKTIAETRDLLLSAVESSNSQPTRDRMMIRGVTLSATAGWATFPGDGASLGELLTAAQRRLVESRATGRSENTPAHGVRRDAGPTVTTISGESEEAQKQQGRVRRALAERSERTWINLVGWASGWLGMLLCLPLLSLTAAEAVGSAAICATALAYAGWRFHTGGRVAHTQTRGAVRYASDLVIAIGIGALAYLTGGFDSPALILAVALVVRSNYVNSHQAAVWRWTYPLLTLWSPLLYSDPFSGPSSKFLLLYVGALTWMVVLATGVNVLNVRRARTARRRALEFQREDPLTGLINRSRFNQLIDGLLLGDGSEFAVLTIDIDRYGAAAGAIANDELMARAAAEVVRVTRAGDDVARTGRSEFSVLARDVGEDAAAEIADVYREAVRRVADAPCAGFAVRGAGSTREELFREASRTLTAQKPRSKPNLLAI